MANLSGSDIRNALSAVPGAVGGQMRSFDELAAGANAALAQAPLGLTAEGAAAFLATMAQESAWFRTTEEYAKNGRYAPYIGRTFQQVTWKDNYRAFGKWLNDKGLLNDTEYFVNNPKALADYKWAWLGGVWYFEYKLLWDEANSGDFLGVQKGVNLGSPKSPHTPAGWATRKKAYDGFLRVVTEVLSDSDNIVKDSSPMTDYVPDSNRKPPSSDRPAFAVRFYAKTRISMLGFATTERGWAMHLEACKLYTARTGKKAPGITQGGWSNSVGASAGTHAREGFDWATAPLTDQENRIWQECCRTVGFADWWRRALRGVWSEHNHGVPKDGILSPSAAAQVKAFKLGRNGLAGNGADTSIGAFRNVTFETYLADRDAPKVKINGKFYADFGPLSVRVLNEGWKDGSFSRRTYVIQDWLASLGLYKSKLDGIAGPMTKAAFNEFRRQYLKWNEEDSTGLPGIKSVEWLRKFVNSARKVTQ